MTIMAAFATLRALPHRRQWCGSVACVSIDSGDLRESLSPEPMCADGDRVRSSTIGESGTRPKFIYLACTRSDCVIVRQFDPELA